MPSAAELWLPPSYEYTKAPPPKLGEKYGGWLAGREDQIQYMQMPGGATLQFDLDRLTLADYRQMRSHYQVNISLSILGFMMNQLDWRIACDDAKIQDAVTDWMAEVWTRLSRGVAQAFWSGYSPMILQWDNHPTEPRIVLDKVKDLRPEDCKVHWKEVDGYAPPNHAKPKLKVFDGIDINGTNAGNGQSWPVPAESSLWYPLLMENGDHYGKKLLKPAFPAWFFSQLIHLFANRYFERFGEPLPIGRAPFDETVDMGGGQSMGGKDVMEMILRNIRNRSVVVLPNNVMPGTNANTGKPVYDYSIEYLESQMRGADFERYLTRLDEEISLGIFTPVLLYRTADVGSYNLGEAHYRLFMSLLNALAGDLKEYLDRYVLDRMVDFNFGKNAARARWIPRKLGKDVPETLRAIIAAMIQAGTAKVDVHELGTALGIGVEEIDPLVAEEAKAKIAAENAPPTITAPGGGANPKNGTTKAGDGTGAGQGGGSTERKPSDNTMALIDRMLFRVGPQATKMFIEGKFGKFDFGHDRQLAEALPGGRLAAQQYLHGIERWAAEAWSAYDNSAQFALALRKVMVGAASEYS